MKCSKSFQILRKTQGENGERNRNKMAKLKSTQTKRESVAVSNSCVNQYGFVPLWVYPIEPSVGT